MNAKSARSKFVRVFYFTVIAVVMFSVVGIVAAEGEGLLIGFHDGAEGSVNAEGCTAFGWVADPDDPNRDLSVHVYVDATLVETITADLLREDVTACTDGTCGFVVRLWQYVTPGQEHQITVKALDVETRAWVDLIGTPKALTCWGVPEGAHDGAEGVVDENSCTASGWAVDPDNRDRDVLVRILVDGNEEAKFAASDYGEDMEQLGICPQGTCRFTVNLFNEVSLNEEHAITAQAYDVETETWFDLGGTPKYLTCQSPPPPPFIAVSLTQHWMMAANFPPETPITFTVYEHQGDSEPVRVLDWYSTDSSGFLATAGWELGWDFMPGNFVIGSGGGVVKELELENVTLDLFDPEHDLVSGTAFPAGRKVDVGVGNADGEQWMTVYSDESTGIWVAYFTDPENEPPEYEFDITEDMWAGGHINDEDGDVTAAHNSEPPMPPMFIWADPVCDCINGWDWNVGDAITLEVFDQDGNPFTLQNPTKTYLADEGVAFYLRDEGIDVQPGYRIIMTNGTIYKDLIVSSLVVKEMDPIGNTIAGLFDPGLELVIHTDGQEPLGIDTNEDWWVASFGYVGGAGEVYQPDEDGDKTGMGWDGVPTFLRYDIYSYDGTSEHRITSLNGTGEYDPSWSPNGKWVAHDVVYWDGSQSLFVTNVATGASRLLTGAEDGGNDAAWSPTGLWIAFDRYWTKNDPNIYIVPFTGGQRYLVRENAITPAWSPTGLRLVVQDLTDGSVKAIGLVGRQEFTVAEYGESPAWSPDGKWIAYQRDGIIWKVRVNPLGMPLGKPVQVTNVEGWADAPAWSGDGSTIAVNIAMGDEWDIWTVPAAGGDVTWLTGKAGFGEYGPDYWRFTVSYAGFTP